MPVVLACSAIAPSAAHAALPLPAPVAEPAAAVETTVAQVVTPVRPDRQPGSHALQQTIAPITHAATAPPIAAAVAAAPRQKNFDEHARPRTSQVAATSSGERTGSGRPAHDHGLDGRRSPSSERTAPAHRAPAEPIAAAHAPAGSAPGAAAAGGAGGFSFAGGGAFALLVASLLLAGPRLRRHLSELPVVCRPAAFLVVLERPG
jgi:hypothetical protein